MKTDAEYVNTVQKYSANLAGMAGAFMGLLQEVQSQGGDFGALIDGYFYANHNQENPTGDAVPGRLVTKQSIIDAYNALQALSDAVTPDVLAALLRVSRG